MQRDDDGIKPDVAISAIRKQLSPMVVRSRAKVTQDRIYSMAYHPEVTKDLIFMGDKHGCLGIWDALAPPETNEDDDEEEQNAEGGRYWRLQPHWPKSSKSSISCVKFSPTDSRNVRPLISVSPINLLRVLSHCSYTYAPYLSNIGAYFGVRLHNPKHVV